MLGEFATWWLRQMRDLVPRRWRRNAARLPDGLIVDCVAGMTDPQPRIAIIRRRNGRELPLGQFVADAAASASLPGAVARYSRRGALSLRLQIAPLERDVVLPLAAENDVANILRYDVQRLTPFTADEVFWSWIIVARDVSRQRLRLRLCIVLKAAVLPLLHRLVESGVVPSTLEACTPDGVIRRMALDGSDAEATRRRGVGRLVVGFTVMIVVLGGLVTPFVSQSIAIADVESRIDTLQLDVKRVEALQHRLAARSVDADVIAAERARVGDALQVLAIVTDSLPNGTYLTDFAMRQRRLMLTGKSTSAAKLIAGLSGHSPIRDPVFTAPVTRDPSADNDSFTIRAEVTP
jgi:general secretion pathway protein L